MTKTKHTNGSIGGGGAATSKSMQFAKICRLCETKDGPFLNIFDADMDLAGKIDNLLPITVMEYDDLPHKVCFRCSAKLTDLYEFVHKCVQTQENLAKSLSKTETKISQNKINKSKKIWSERLFKHKLTNNAFCEGLVKKGLKAIGKNLNDNLKSEFIMNPTGYKHNVRLAPVVAEVEEKVADYPPKSTANPIEKSALGLIRCKNIEDLNKKKEEKAPVVTPKQEIDHSKKSNQMAISAVQRQNGKSENSANREDPDFNKDIRVCISRVSKDSTSQYEVKRDKTPPPKENVSMFKVAGVGTVYSCGDCTRIFLNKDTMPGHKCVTNAPPKEPVIDLCDISQDKPNSRVPKKKKPGPASKTLLNKEKPNKDNNEQQNGPTSPIGSIDTIMKKLIGNSMQYQLVTGPNNTLTLQATPQPINIPLNVVATPAATPQPTPPPLKNFSKSPIVSLTPTSTSPVVPKNAIVNQKSAISKTPIVLKEDPKPAQKSAPKPMQKPAQRPGPKRSKAKPQNETPPARSDISKQFTSLKPSSSASGPFPVAFAKNLYMSEEPAAARDDNDRGAKRRSREAPDRSKKAKINPEVIELDDDDAPEDTLLVERVTRKRGQAGRRAADPSPSQQYRVVPNDNPRKLIISLGAGSSAAAPSSKRDKRNRGGKAGDGYCEDSAGEESILPDKTVVQEPRVSTTVPARRGRPPAKAEPRQKCMMCNLSFPDNAKLSAHMKVHYANWI